MFAGCSSLETAPSILPAMNLTQGCYGGMFKGCKKLSRAPILPATTLASQCYEGMFNDCYRLRFIKMMAIEVDVNEYSCFDWVQGVPTTGTFVKNSAATWNITGPNGIPEGWTVETASE
jgi:hypothetical protein